MRIDGYHSRQLSTTLSTTSAGDTSRLQISEAPLGGASLGSVMSCQFAGRKKWLTARLPIFSPWSVPVSTASRKWKPT